MPIRVLVVDDSSFIRHRVSAILNGESGIEVIGEANDGVDAVRKAMSLRPDVITMDVEMPVLDGISAVRRIMRECPTPILMLSHSTQAGAKATFDALEAGAVDFLPKDLDGINQPCGEGQQTLIRRIRDLGRAKPRRPETNTAALSTRACVPPRGLELIVMAASTGGPVALQKILAGIPRGFTLPIVIVQHMPAQFTATFAERLNSLCQIKVTEARDGDVLSPGVALLAPGGKQMEIIKRERQWSARIRKSQATELFQPSADVTFSSVAKTARGGVLAMVLTGMGNDGKEGAVLLKQCGATIWAQEESSCAVYGMPRAVVEAHLAHGIYSPEQIAAGLSHI